MIRIGSTTINKVFLGSTLINKVYLGSNQVYPTGGAGGGSNVLERFDSYSANIPQDLSWSFGGSEDPSTYGPSALHVTEGAFSYRWADTIAEGNLARITATGVNLSSANSISVDVYILTSSADGFASLSANGGDKTSHGNDSSAQNETGAITLTIDTSLWTMKSNVTVSLLYFGVTGGSYEIFWDNLRYT